VPEKPGQPDFSTIADELASIVKRAGEFVTKNMIISFTMEGSTDVVTNIDSEIHEYLATELAAVLPADMLSEEGTVQGQDQEYAWIVDPLDGTLNVVAGSPDIAIAVALTVRPALAPEVGVVYAPRHRLLYHAVRGRGAYCNGRMLPRRQETFPPIVSLGQPSNAQENARDFGQRVEILVRQGWIIRQSGSAALDICRTAEGTWQAFHEKGLYLWDVAAAHLIATEAGCLALLQPTPSYGSHRNRVDYLVARTKGAMNGLEDSLWR
jgi:myo-inositol-1(or 4)-monophosphatase